MAASATVESEAASNPLLHQGDFPLFDQIKAEDVVPGMKRILEDVENSLKELEENAKPTWSGLVEPLETLIDKLNVPWGAVSHLKGVKDSEALRTAVEEIQPLQVTLSSKFAQSQPLYNAFCALRDGPQWKTLTEAQKRIVEGEIRDAKLGGVGLEGKEKERFNEIQQELSKLSLKFSNNVLDSTKAFKKVITDAKEVAGLPESALALAAQTAVTNGHEAATASSGPWVITLDFPSYLPVMTHCTYRPLREELYRAFISRASSGERDNTPIIEKILALRKEKAQMLGYNSHADVSMAAKMATLPKAQALLEELRAASYDSAVQELADVQAFAKEAGAAEALKHWDMTFWAERMKEEQYELKEEELRPYFALPVVMDGMFALAQRLFQITITPADGTAPVWHPDVRLYKVACTQTGSPLAYFYLDPYSRPEEKRGGAWMDEVVGRSKLLGKTKSDVRLPVAHMVCNQSPPIGGDPSLMTFREVETMFHEFGHALQHMLTTQDEGMVAGIRGVEWDAVELPSQFMENWCYHRPTINGIAKHYQTGEVLPEALYQKIVKVRSFRFDLVRCHSLSFPSRSLSFRFRFAFVSLSFDFVSLSFAFILASFAFV
jgi:oligopeptidase A